MQFKGEPPSRFSLGGSTLEGRLGRFRRGGLAIKKPDLTDDDFRSVAFAAAVLRLVLAGLQPSFDVDLAAFADEPADYGAA